MVADRTEFGMRDIAVIIPTYNAAPFIRNAIGSVVEQTASDWELIVIDDGSTDRTAEIVSHYLSDPRVRYVRQDNRGPSAARNHGVRLTSAKYVAFLDADDALAPNALAVLRSKLNQDFEIGWATSDVVWVSGVDVNAPHRQLKPAAIPVDLYYGILRDEIENNIGRALFFRREALLSAGLFDEQLQLRSREDWELNIRMIHAGIRFVYIPEPLYLHHVREGTLTGDTRGVLDATYHVLEKHHKHLADRGDQRAARIYAENLWVLGRRSLEWHRDLRRAALCLYRALRYDYQNAARLMRAVQQRVTAKKRTPDR
jgi:glycosyltransferase involved in cell wall biosynthesis